MSGLLVPVAVVVVGHHVDDVQIPEGGKIIRMFESSQIFRGMPNSLAHGLDIVGLVDDGLAGGDGGSEEEPLGPEGHL